jgi:hypothetical protein
MPQSKTSEFFKVEELETLQIKGDKRFAERAKYFMVVGAFVVAWSTLEYVLDLCIVAIYHHAPGGKKLSKDQPLALSAKLDLFEKAHTKLDPLKPHAKTALRLSKLIRGMGEVRHTLAHSVAVDSDVLEQAK